MKKYRYKLNMLEPGLLMLKIMAVSGLFSLLFSFLKQDALSWIFGLAAFLLFLILLILLIIEQRQDHQMYLDAKKENPEVK